MSAEYKDRYRSLIFNLRDAKNPQLRQRVLQGEVDPHQLVRMSAAEMASKVGCTVVSLRPVLCTAFQQGHTCAAQYWKQVVGSCSSADQSGQQLASC